MRVSLSTVAAMTVALASGVDAFWLVTNTIEGGLGGPVGGTGNQWSFVSNPDSCDEVTHAERYNQYSDVSGPGTGIRIKWKKGSGSECDKFLGCQVPDIVEMHREQWHWTWYSNQGEQLRNVGGKVVGHCRQAMGHTKGCNLPVGAYAYVQSLIQCDVN